MRLIRICDARGRDALAAADYHGQRDRHFADLIRATGQANRHAVRAPVLLRVV